MLTEVTENTHTFQIPTLGEKIKAALPIPVSPTEARKRLIEEVAEELHPGNWCLSDSEQTLHPLFEELAPRIGNKNCGCNSCEDRQYERCTNNENRLKHKRLVIRIPEATIRNSRDESHYMEDFYVAIGFRDDYSKAITTNMFSMRSTVTTVEYACGAFHPHSHHEGHHSSLDSYFQWRRMCLGGDTELTDIMYTLYNDGVTKKPLFELMLLLHIYAGWESLEGGPYRTISQYKYPRDSSSGLRAYFNQDTIYKGFLKVLASTDDIPRPEIIGNTNALAISNTGSSMVPAIKGSMLELLSRRSEIDESTVRGIFTYLGTNIGPSFSPLYNSRDTELTQKSREWYENKVAETVEWSRENADSVLKFRGGINFVMKLEEEGLGRTQTEPTEEQIAQATVHPEVVRIISNEYLSNLKQFKARSKF